MSTKSEHLSAGTTATKTQNLALTTVFTPPTECITPFITTPDAGCDEITCFALFMPSLVIDSTTGAAHLQCLPSFATDSDLKRSSIFVYSPGLFCPSDMTTVNTTLAPRSAVPAGTFGGGTRGEDPDIGYVNSTSVLSPFQHIYAKATLIILIQQNGGNNDGSSVQAWKSESINSTALKADLITAQPGSTNTSSPQPGPRIAAIVGGVLGGVGFIIALALGYFFLSRYRRRRDRTRNTPSQPIIIPENEAGQTQDYPGDGTGGFWYQKPELDATTTRMELEGTTIDQQGPGIYVVKPELEGTVVKNRLLDVFLKGKAELEGNRSR
ncbi:hypothetical protein F5Y19DRAFT_490449 [Xylariaceae sp. FL1651]|nr:hypothetical protein F5Y19DRAFT_490449 [Xylariaceae sp. FL1651]